MQEEKHARKVEDLRKEVMVIFVKTEDPLAKLELIDTMEKVGVAYIFEEEIKEALEAILSSNYIKHPTIREDLYATSLCFRLLRQRGYIVPQGIYIYISVELCTCVTLF